MIDFSNSVILPRDEYIELSTTAWGQNTTVADRVAGTLQTTAFCTVLVAAFSAGTYVWYKAMSKLEDKKLANDILAAEEKQKIYNQK